MKSILDDFARRLEDLEDVGLRRRLLSSDGIDFSSNDYLGLASYAPLGEAIVRKFQAVMADPRHPTAAPASRLLRGQTEQHRSVEQRLAAYKGTAGALLFPSGYQANVGLLSTLITPQDRVLSDELNHASLIDGLRLARCHKVILPHLDLAALEHHLAQPHPQGRTFVLTESLFSMNGDLAPLDLYADLAEHHGAALLVDDAHATGLFGRERGSGLTEHFGVENRVLAITSTFGKACATAGAFIAGPALMIDYLINRCRSFIFSTAVQPLQLCAVEAALDILATEPERRQRVLQAADSLRLRLRQLGCDCLDSRGPIVPVILGNNRRAVAVAQELQAAGFDVRAIRPPSVEPGTARLRISVHADHQPQQLDQLVEAMAAALRTEPADVAIPVGG